MSSSRSPSNQNNNDRNHSPKERERERDQDDPKRDSQSLRRSQSQDSIQNKGNTLYVGNLGPKITRDIIEDRFKEFGKVKNIEISKDPKTRGFAFVIYEQNGDAEVALGELHNSKLDGRTIVVEKAKRSKPHDKTPGNYLGPIPRSSRRSSDRRSHSRSRRDRDRRRSRTRSRSRDRYRSRDYDRRSSRYDRKRRSHSRSRSPNRRNNRRSSRSRSDSRSRRRR